MSGSWRIYRLEFCHSQSESEAEDGGEQHEELRVNDGIERTQTRRYLTPYPEGEVFVGFRSLTSLSKREVAGIVKRWKAKTTNI